MDKFENRCVIPKRHKEFDWEKLPNEDYVKICRIFLENYEACLDEGRGLILWGPYSHGKSALACEFLRQLPTGRTGLFVRSVEVPGYLINDTEFDPRQTFHERMKTVDLLVLDEFILHDGGSFRDTCVELLVRYRISEMRSIIITTNHPPKFIRENYQAFHEATKECLIPLQIKGKDFRADKSSELMEEMTGGLS